MSNSFFYTRIEYQLTDKIGEFILISQATSPWSGDKLMCGGGGPDASTIAAQNANTASIEQQTQFDSQLMTLFNAQYASQQNTLSYLKGQLQPVISQAEAGKGMSDSTLAAMRTGATDTLSTDFTNSQETLNNTLRTSGDVNIPSGVTVGADKALLASEATAKASAQQGITEYDQNLANSNLFNAMNVLNGVAAQANPLGYATAATSGTSSVAAGAGAQANLQQAVTASEQSPLASILGAAMGGAGTAIGGIYCWVAAKIFGENFLTGFKTAIVRDYLLNTWSKKFYAKPVLWAYGKYGKWISEQPVLVRGLTPLFNTAFSEAMAW